MLGFYLNSYKNAFDALLSNHLMPIVCDFQDVPHASDLPKLFWSNDRQEFFVLEENGNTVLTTNN